MRMSSLHSTLSRIILLPAHRNSSPDLTHCIKQISVIRHVWVCNSLQSYFKYHIVQNGEMTYFALLYQAHLICYGIAQKIKPTMWDFLFFICFSKQYALTWHHYYRNHVVFSIVYQMPSTNILKGNT